MALGSLLALTGCSYAYDLRAIIIHGRLAFIVDPASEQQPDCIRSIHVQTDQGKTRANLGDDPGLVANGVFWYEDYAVDACQTAFRYCTDSPCKVAHSSIRAGPALV